jgi:hypothetical protein
MKLRIDVVYTEDTDGGALEMKGKSFLNGSSVWKEL